MINRTRQLVTTALITSLLSILIGGFAVWGSYRSEISTIDRQIDLIENEIERDPADAINIALLRIEQRNLDFTLAFVAKTGEISILHEAAGTQVKGKNLHIRHIPILEGDKLILTRSLIDINKSKDRNLLRLLLFILMANILALLVSSLLTRSSALAQERVQRAKMQEFLGDAAHELRTPMTVIKGYAELLKTRTLEPDRELAAFDRLNSELKRMDFLISDLLMLAQLGEENSDTAEEIDLSALIYENVEDFKTISPTRELTNQVPTAILVIGEAKYLARFIQNALTNIRLHTPENTKVRISATVGKEIKLIIEDSGPGLPAESYGEKIRGLKRFDRSRARDSGGTGLGLSIMSAVIERHHGTLTLRKSELGGLAIEVHLPRT